MNEELVKDLHDEIKYGTNIVPQDEYLDTLITIADVAADMVVKTLGPYGKTTLLNDGVFTYPTKDGWSVLKSLRFNDAVFNVLYDVLKQVSFSMVSIVGDNTTGAFVAANKFMHIVIDRILTKDYRQADVINMIKEIGEEIIQKIESSKFVKHCTDENYESIRKVAWVSSNGNDELADMIQDIYKKTGNPNIYVTLDPRTTMSYEIQEGYKYDCNPLQQRLYVNSDDHTYQLRQRSVIFILNHNATYQEHSAFFDFISKYYLSRNVKVFILAPYYDDVLSNMIGMNITKMVNNGKMPNLMLIQIPLSNRAQVNYLNDVILLTGADPVDIGKIRKFNQLIRGEFPKEEEKKDEDVYDDEDRIMKYAFKSPEEIVETCQGVLASVVVGKNYILIENYDSVVNKNVYKETLHEVETEYREMKAKMDKNTTPLYKDYMNAYQHYTKLYGKMGTIYVGGASELEKHFMKDAVDDAVLSCRSAFEYGFVRGLNLTTLNVINDMINEIPNEERSGIRFEILQGFYDAFFELSLEVFNNANGDKSTHHVTNIVGSTDNPGVNVITMSPRDILKYCVAHECGYDITSNVIMPDEDCNVLNSVRSDTETIKAIVGILSIVLTSNQFLTINRSYDRMIGIQQRRETIVKNDAERYGAIAEEIYDRLKDKIPYFMQRKSAIVSKTN